MTSDQTAAFKDLEQAQQALKIGDKNAARQLAAHAAQIAPELEEVWLLMAALASPRGSVAYLEKALKINPTSERAQKGMRWAQTRVEHELESGTEISEPAAEQPEPTREPEEKPILVPVTPEISKEEVLEEPGTRFTETNDQALSADLPEPETEPDVVTVVENKGGLTRNRYSLPALLAILILLLAGWFAWQARSSIAAYFSSNNTSQQQGPAWARVIISKSNAPVPTVMIPVLATATLPGSANEPLLVSPTPDLSSITGTHEAAATPLPSLTSPPTATSAAADIPLPSMTSPPTGTSEAAATPLPSLTSPPTETPPGPAATLASTETPLPTDVIPAAATQDSGANSFEQPSPTPLPTDTAAPFATQFSPASPSQNNGSSQGSGHWIDVDLTHQMVYAYDDNTLVNSFLVSTGTWQYPTVTGQYHIYIKLRYKDMSGPGYYLPNVPFTMFFYQGYALHGTYWHSNFGTPMSHGCVNLTIPDSEWIYNFASVGTLVNVHY